MSSESERYRAMSDHDLAIINATKMDALTTKMDNFIAKREQLQVTHECRMAELEAVTDDHEVRINTLETYFKVAVGAIVLAVGVFGVYLVDLMVGG